MRKLIVRRVWIERSSCLWHTLCEPEAPGLIENDEANSVFRIKEESDGLETEASARQPATVGRYSERDQDLGSLRAAAGRNGAPGRT
jgi:hypothetical protein